MKATNTIEIEFDTPTNANVLFAPLQRIVRGRFDVRRMPNAGKLYSQWPEPIPGQRLTINFDTGECEIREPLWDASENSNRERIEAKGMKLPTGSEQVKADPATLHYWSKSLIDSGKCRVVSGQLPAKVDGKPQTRFHSTEHVDPIDRLTAAIETQNELFAKLLAKLADK